MNRSLQIKAGLTIVVLLLSFIGLMPTIKALSISSTDREAAQVAADAGDDTRLKEISAIDAKAIKRGLDLEGGIYMVLEVDQEGMTPTAAKKTLLQVQKILVNRIDRFGVSEPEITTSGINRIIVKLPGVKEIDRAKALLGKTAKLEFLMVRTVPEAQEAMIAMDNFFLGDTPLETVTETPEASADAPVEAGAEADASVDSLAEATEPADDALAGLESEEDFIKKHPFTSMLTFPQQGGVFVAGSRVTTVREMAENERALLKLDGVMFQIGAEGFPLGDGELIYPLYLVDAIAVITGEMLVDATAGAGDQPGSRAVNFTLSRRGGALFSDLTADNVDRQLAISLDGVIASAPRINGRIPQGRGQITGNFSQAEANDLALLLRAGALPATITMGEERTVGPSLGRDSIRAGVSAALYGSVLVIIFMLIYYRASGVVTVIALVSNIIILMAVLGQFGLVLTLPGIAGIILTVGMAVDANVLINERIREELRKNKTIRAAVQSGYANATRTIIDANVTTLIAGLVLLRFGTGAIKGFAVTLSIGIVTSMFTALIMTRVIMELMTRKQGKKKISI
jgi:SecD/SecF fusion protein